MIDRIFADIQSEKLTRNSPEKTDFTTRNFGQQVEKPKCGYLLREAISGRVDDGDEDCDGDW